MVQEDIARCGREGRGGHEVEVGGGLGEGYEGEGREEAGEIVCGAAALLEPGDCSSDAEEDCAESLWTLEYVGCVCMADVFVLETRRLHKQPEGAFAGGHGGEGGGRGESGGRVESAPPKTCQQIPAAPRLAFSSFPSNPLGHTTSQPHHHLSTAMPAIPHPHSPTQPLPAAEHASDSSTHAQADSPADTAHPVPPSDQKVKKKRLGVDPSLIIAEGGRSKRRRTPSPQPEQKEQVNLDPKDSARAQELGMVIYEKIMDSKTKE